MALILAVRRVADFFGESVICVLKSAHHGRVDTGGEDFEEIKIAGRTEKTVEGFGVRAAGGGETEDSAVGGGDYGGGVGGGVGKFGGAGVQLRVEFFCELVASFGGLREVKVRLRFPIGE